MLWLNIVAKIIYILYISKRTGVFFIKLIKLSIVGFSVGIHFWDFNILNYENAGHPL